MPIAASHVVCHKRLFHVAARLRSDDFLRYADFHARARWCRDTVLLLHIVAFRR